MNKLYIIPTLGFIGVAILEFISIITYAAFGSYIAYNYQVKPYFLIIFQFFIILGFLIIYLEKKQKIGFVIFCVGLVFLLIHPFFQLFGIPYLAMIFNLQTVGYIGLLDFVSPMIFNGFLLVCCIGFFILHKKAQSQTAEIKTCLKIAGNMFLFYFIFQNIIGITSYILFFLDYVMGISVGALYSILPILSVFNFVFILVASINASKSFIKIRWEQFRFPIEPRHSLQINVKNLSLFVLFSFILTIFFLGIITAIATRDFIWGAVQFPLISFLIYFSSAGSSFIQARNAPRIITVALIFQLFLSFMLGIMLPNIAKIIGLFSSSLSNNLNLTIFIIGFITYLIFPYLIVFFLKQIEGQNIGKVLRFSFWNFFIFLIIFPGTVFLSKFTWIGPYSTWPFLIQFTFFSFKSSGQSISLLSIPRGYPNE